MIFRRRPDPLLERIAIVASQSGAHEAIVRYLYNAYFTDGDLQLLALPSSWTGRRLIRAGFAKAINAGPTPYGYDTCGDLVATQYGLETWTFLHGKALVPLRVEKIDFKAGDSAFWLDPYLWEKTPVLPDGRHAPCWMHA